MTTDLTPFSYIGHQVRVVTRDGEPWFVLADVCGVLELSNPTMAARGLDHDALSTAEVIDSMGRQQTVRVVAEPGLYELVFQSRKPEAREFRRWVTREVLPEIRKTGSFGGVAVAQIPDMDTPEGQLQVAELLAAAARRQIEQAAEIKVPLPSTNESTYSAFGLSRIAGTRWSHSKQRNETVYQYYALRGYESWFIQRDQPEAPRLHNGQMQTTLYVTPVGKVQIAALVAREGEAS